MSTAIDKQGGILVGKFLDCLPNAELQLARFRRQYLQRLDVKQVRFPDPALLRIWEVQEWVWSFIETNQRESPCPQYEKLFLKQLQLKLEDAVKDAEEPVRVYAMSSYCTCLVR